VKTLDLTNVKQQSIKMLTQITLPARYTSQSKNPLNGLTSNFLLRQVTLNKWFTSSESN